LSLSKNMTFIKLIVRQLSSFSNERIFTQKRLREKLACFLSYFHRTLQENHEIETNV